MRTSNKNKKIRNITVNNTDYKWYVGDRNSDGDDNCVFKIYKDKKVLYKKMVSGQITPKIVRDTIIKHNL